MALARKWARANTLKSKAEGRRQMKAVVTHRTDGILSLPGIDVPARPDLDPSG